MASSSGSTSSVLPPSVQPPPPAFAECSTVPWPCSDTEATAGCMSLVTVRVEISVASLPVPAQATWRLQLAPVGKMSFAADSLVANAHALVDSIVKAKPSAAKGKYLKSVTLSSTMGPGVRIDTTHIDVAVKH